MKLLILYGPPASGKMTVGRELERLTGLPLFHNHLTIGLAKVVMPEVSLERYHLINALRLCVFRAASEAGNSLTFTFVRKTPSDDDFLREAVRVVESNGGQVLFVHLVPHYEVLEVRLSADSRIRNGKITESSQLQKLSEKSDLYAHIEHSNSLTIDNGQLSEYETARRIVDFFNLELLPNVT